MIIAQIVRRQRGGFLVRLECGHELEQDGLEDDLIGSHRVAVVFADDYAVECPHCVKDLVGDKLFDQGFEKGQELAIKTKFISAKHARESIAVWITMTNPQQKTTKVQRRRWMSGLHAGFWKALEHEPWHKNRSLV